MIDRMEDTVLNKEQNRWEKKIKNKLILILLTTLENSRNISVNDNNEN